MLMPLAVSSDVLQWRREQTTETTTAFGLCMTADASEFRLRFYKPDSYITILVGTRTL